MKDMTPMPIDLTTSRPFGRTGFAVSPLTLGTSGWGPPKPEESDADRDERLARLGAAFFERRVPMTAIDTSNMYGGGHSESYVGAALRAAGGSLDGLLLQTKLDRDMQTDDFSADRMERSLEESLERLGVDHLPLLFLHDPESVGFRAAMAKGGPVDALVAMRERGVVTSIGISGGPVGMLQSFVETDVFDALVSHNRFTLVDRSADALCEAATSRGVGIDNAAVYGGGVLTGDARFAGSYGYGPIKPQVADAVQAISRLCTDGGFSLSAAALQFSLRDPRIHSTIIGATSLDRIGDFEAEAAADIPEDFWTAVDAVLPPPSAALDADDPGRGA